MGASRRTRGKTRTRSVITILAALALVGSLTAPSGAYERPGETTRVSVGSDGSESEPILTGDCWRVAGGPALRQFDISSNGRFVAFTTDAPNLVPGDANASCDVFVHDLKTRKTERVSQPANGTDSVGVCVGIVGGTNASTGSSGPSLSASGRYVAFHSCATNLVAGDTNGLADIFVADRKSGSIKRVSLTISDRQVLGLVHALTPSISSDGQTVAYLGSADDLTTSPLGSIRIWVRDLASGQIQLASPCGSNGCATVEYPTISGDGRYVSYTSMFDDSDSTDTNFTGYDVVRFDRKIDKVELVSVTDANTSGNNRPVFDFSLGTRSYGGRTMNEDGRYVAFSSHASNLIPNDGNNDPLNGGDVFVRDMATGRTERMSVGSSGQELYLSRQDETCNRVEGVCLPVANYWYPAISANGRFVIFATGGTARIIVHDRLTGQNTIAVRSPRGGAPDCIREGQEQDGEGQSLKMNPGALSGNGRVAVFGSNCVNLVSGDSNGHYDTFVRDLGPVLGAGGFGNSPSPKQDPQDDRICITPDLCIPPGATVSSNDSVDDLTNVLTQQGANLYGASLAHRPQYSDLFGVIELEHMPQVLPGPSPIFYALRFEVEGKSYEVRATSLLGGTFGLFDCTYSRTCTKVADLSGGYGTTGERVVFSLPLDKIGLEDGGELKDVEAFSGLGSYMTGSAKILDTVRLK